MKIHDYENNTDVVIMMDKPRKKRRKAMGILHLPKDVTSNATYKNWHRLWHEFMVFTHIEDKNTYDKEIIEEYVFMPEVTERFIRNIVKSMKGKHEKNK